MPRSVALQEDLRNPEALHAGARRPNFRPAQEDAARGGWLLMAGFRQVSEPQPATANQQRLPTPTTVL